MKYILVLVAAVLLAGCKSTASSDDDSPQAGVIRPLKIGNYWHYKWTNYDLWGYALQVQELTERIVRDSLIGTEPWYVISYDSLEVGHYLSNRAEGLYTYDADDYLVPIPRLWIPYPAAVGKSAVYKFDPQGMYADSLYLKALNVPITTPAGTFSCYQFVEVITYAGQKSMRENYYAPGVGLVRSDLYNHDINPYIFEVHELQDYKAD